MYELLARSVPSTFRFKVLESMEVLFWAKVHASLCSVLGIHGLVVSFGRAGELVGPSAVLVGPPHLSKAIQAPNLLSGPLPLLGYQIS